MSKVLCFKWGCRRNDEELEKETIERVIAVTVLYCLVNIFSGWLYGFFHEGVVINDFTGVEEWRH